MGKVWLIETTMPKLPIRAPAAFPLRLPPTVVDVVNAVEPACPHTCLIDKTHPVVACSRFTQHGASLAYRGGIGIWNLASQAPGTAGTQTLLPSSRGETEGGVYQTHIQRQK